MVVAVEQFILEPGHRGTLQRQVQEIVTNGILAGRFRPGDRMPSSRGLAQYLGISRITVTLAYTDLVASDYLTARGRSGYYVSESAPEPATMPVRACAESRVDWSRALSQRVPSSQAIARPEDWRRYRYPFIYGQTDARLFDQQNWRKCALQALGTREFRTLTEDSYGRDDPFLVDQIIRHILPRRGIGAAPSEVLITMGAQNALWALAQVLLTQRRTAVMERPCYPALREILERSRCATAEIPVDEHGLPPGDIPEGADVVFVTPSHQCPTSATMPVARRRALLEMAERDDFLIVEDDYEPELAFASAPAPALKSLDRGGRVAYIGSFAKSLFPGLRLGYVVAPEPLIRELRALRSLTIRHVPGHLQRATAFFLAGGHHDAQVRRLGRAFRERRSVAEREIAEHRLCIAGANTFGGSSIWMRAPEGVASSALAEALRARDVLIEPAGPFFGPTRDPETHYRLAYSSIAAADIPEGIARIAEVGATLSRTV